MPARKSGDPLEKVIVAKIADYAKSDGWLAVKIHGGAYQVTGFPDLLLLRDGLAATIEVKRPGCEPTRVQMHWMRRLIEHGVPSAVCTSVGDAREFLEHAFGGAS